MAGAETAATGDVNRRPGAATSRRGEAGLGLAMGFGNALSYAFVLIVTRLLGPDAFGAYSAINTLGIVFVIPAGVLQVVVATRWGKGVNHTTGLRAAHLVGVGLTLLTALVAWPLQGLFHVASPLPILAMALMLWPMTVTGALGGVMLGSGRLGALSIQYLTTALTRVTAAWVCAVCGASLTQVFLATAAASAVTLAVGWWLIRDVVRAHPSASGAGVGRDVLLGSSSLAAFTALTNVDVVLARHFLSPEASGGYALASTFGRAMCWGTQFVALLIVPRIAQRAGTTLSADGGAQAPSRADIRVKACAFIIGIGALAAGVLAVNPEFFVQLAGGHAYRGYGMVVLGCVGLGTMWALVQLFLFSQMAQTSSWLGWLTWAVAVGEALVGWFVVHDSPAAIVGLATSGALIVVVSAVLDMTWRRTHPDAG